MWEAGIRSLLAVPGAAVCGILVAWLLPVLGYLFLSLEYQLDRVFNPFFAGRGYGLDIAWMLISSSLLGGAAHYYSGLSIIGRGSKVRSVVLVAFSLVVAVLWCLLADGLWGYVRAFLFFGGSLFASLFGESLE